MSCGLDVMQCTRAPNAGRERCCTTPPPANGGSSSSHHSDSSSVGDRSTSPEHSALSGTYNGKGKEDMLVMMGCSSPDPLEVPMAFGIQPRRFFTEQRPAGKVPSVDKGVGKQPSQTEFEGATNTTSSTSSCGSDRGDTCSSPQCSTTEGTFCEGDKQSSDSGRADSVDVQESQQESAKELPLSDEDKEKQLTAADIIENGWTSVMIQNLPRHLTQEMVREKLEETGFAQSYDFFYAPRIFSSGCGRGYAFINFYTAQQAAQFFPRWKGAVFWHNQKLPIAIVKAEVQGITALLGLIGRQKLHRIKNPTYRPFIREGLTEMQ
mmetsp:Transcript_54290/g.129385  ORF Transcript_54290/g.129385 Transcript_54290/m.129385 type:complete len:322 (-) Transcript_54290:23-988(-)